MDFNRASILKSGIPVNDLYNMLSLEGLSTTEYTTGVLLYLCTSKTSSCSDFSKQRVVCVLTEGGHIVHDTGDVILAAWVNENMLLSTTISQAVHCAFKLMDIFKIQHAVYDFALPVHIVISAGMFTRVQIVHEGKQAVFVFGPAVDEIRSSEVLAQYGNIILSPEAWMRCYRQDMLAEHIGNEGAVRVEHIRDCQIVSKEDLTYYNSDITTREYPRRAYLIGTVEREFVIREFMMQNALQHIYETKECKMLPEIWPVTVMFVNVQFVQKQTTNSCEEVTDIITEQMCSCRGKICNCFYFDEGCICLCVVGIPGDTRQHKTTFTVLAARQIHDKCLRQITNISTVSVGLTTGRVSYYQTEICLRKKYHVYGEKVNLAAKLTLDYPGIVSCDVATKLYSMLPSSSLMPEEINNNEGVHYEDEVLQMFANDYPMSLRGIDGRRLALAHMQTMLPDERIVMKYASILGHKFSIDMLQHILPPNCVQNLAGSLESLVRVGIFKCAFIPSNGSSTETCSSMISDEEYMQAGAAPVWSCRVMRFSNNDEMKMVHSLIQKNKHVFREIHIKCAKYLESKMYRCSSCQPEKFIFRHRSFIDNTELLKCFFHQDEITYEDFHTDTEKFLIKVDSVLNAEFCRATSGSCECAQLVETRLIPRVRHWRYAGDVPKTFDCLLECAAACVYLRNYTRALKFLTVARSILDNLKKGKAAFRTADPGFIYICAFQQAFIYRLTGEILYKAGKILEAEEKFKKVLKLLDCEYPSSSAVQYLKLKYEKRKNHQYLYRRFKIRKQCKLNCLHECIVCLSYLWQIGCMRGQFLSASLAMTMQINLAVQTTDTFKILYTAIDYLKYCQIMGKERKCKRLEAFLCRTCTSMPDHPEGLRLISDLTQTLAVVKLRTGDLVPSVKFTIQAQQLSEILNGSGRGPGPGLGLDVRVTAALHLPLLFTDRYEECVQQVLTLEKLSKELKSRVAKGWFYAACMNLLLYVGFAFIPFEECCNFVDEFQSDADLNADKSLMLHLYSAVALWYARLEDWEKFAVYLSKAHKVNTQIPSSIQSINGVVMFLECNVLLYKKELTECNRKREITLKRTQKLFTDFTETFGKDHIFAPCVQHLIAYLHQLNGNKLLVDYLLLDALFLCEKQGNHLEQRLIRQSQGDWSGECYCNPYEWSRAARNSPNCSSTLMLQPEDLHKMHFKNVEDNRHRRWPPHITKNVHMPRYLTKCHIVPALETIIHSLSSCLSGARPQGQQYK